MDITIRPISTKDCGSIISIYLEGIATGNATFQTTAPSWEDWNQGHLEECRYVAEIEGNVVGWAALSPVSSRCVYHGVAEVSVYVSDKVRSKGVGKALMNQLISESEHMGFWTLQSGIFPENRASIALHKQAGFREVGYREKMGQLNHIWRNVILMERRSQKIQ